MRVGIIGFGFMGGVHLNAWQQVEGVEIVSICSSRPIGNKVKEGNISSVSSDINLVHVKQYRDLNEMLKKEQLDAVSITLPTHLHKEVSIQCLEAGLHVLCEKPMALNTKDCEAMIDAAQQAGKELMVAHCIRFWPAYAWLKTTADSKIYGTLRSAEFDRRTYAPAWSGDSWFSDPNKSGGLALDLHIHDLDFIQHLLGRPRHIESRHQLLDHGQVGFIHSQLDYGEAPYVSATASWLMPESFGFNMKYTIVFEKATALFDGESLRVFHCDGSVFEPELPAGDGYLHQIKYFSDLIQSKVEKTMITPEQAATSVSMALESTSS